MMINQERHFLSPRTRRCLSIQQQQPIVIVDDSKDDRALLALCLRSFIASDKPVICLKSGRELLDYFTDLEMENAEAEEFEVEIPDMIFLDLLMMEMNGIQTLQALRRRAIWSDVPVTLVTCSRDDMAIKQAERAGANAFLPKPFTKFDVMQVLNRTNNFSPTIM